MSDSAEFAPNHEVGLAAQEFIDRTPDILACETTCAVQEGNAAIHRIENLLLGEIRFEKDNPYSIGKSPLNGTWGSLHLWQDQPAGRIPVSFGAQPHKIFTFRRLSNAAKARFHDNKIGDTQHWRRL
ncbi:hypothetical protein [Corynebacterium sp. HMSC05E07]|uniref:hypothetical protein n=1 Tax=Corynebacterium sp. HMSC05E07 TaxID=1581117 RepID=UPI001FEDC28E|nr:hypothetical protein [Corynebacterium sp. HMSC05E07]